MLLMTLMITGSLALLGAGLLRSAALQLELGRLTADSLRVEITVDSGLAYSLRQLALDSAWSGTGEDWVQIPASGRFQVVRLDDGSDASRVHLCLFAEYLEATARYEVEVTATTKDAGDAWIGKALVTLGSDFMINNADITGGMLIVDDPAGVLDFDPLSGTWGPSALTSTAQIDDNNWALWSGRIETWGAEYGSGYFNSFRDQMSAPARMPVWDLDAYLVPGADRMVTTETDFNGLVTDQTLVVVAAPGAQIRITNCQIGGGLVVWHEPGFDPRQGPRNTLRINNAELGGSDRGIHPGLGIVAPGARMTHYNNSHPLEGLVHLQSADKINNVTIHGALIVTDGAATDLVNLDVELPAWLWNSNDPFPGLSYGGVAAGGTAPLAEPTGTGMARVDRFWPVFGTPDLHELQALGLSYPD
ncbi:MAG TPA: hypothetical protein VGC54_02395 [Planctomycetota bacterium]